MSTSAVLSPAAPPRAAVPGAQPTRRAACPPGPIHSLPAVEVYAALGSSPRGLTADEAAARLQRVGPNAIQEIRGKPLYLKFLANFTHLMALLLWAGGVIGFLAQLPQLGIAIWSVNVINGAFSFWQEFKAEKATAALRRLLPQQARVVRDGEERCIPAETLVPGDVILLEAGERVSADARLVEDADIQLDQSTLTGESRPVRKSSRPLRQRDLARLELPNLVFSGTTAVAGDGRAVVTATGMRTEFGRVAHLTQALVEVPSPLQIELATATRAITLVTIGIGIAFFALAVFFARMDLAAGFIFAMGMIVAFIPEGLLPTVTLSLAMGVQRMARRHALVKRLSAVETLGCTSVICTDKTGTLTQNEMTVRHVWLPGRADAAGRRGRRLSLTGVGYDPAGALEPDGDAVPPPDGDVRLLLSAGALCTNARLLPPSREAPSWTALGDPTEAALQVAARKAGIDLEAAAAAFPRVLELPFDSGRKRMSTVHAPPHPDGGRVLFVKGAPRETLALCERVRCDGRDLPLDDATRAAALGANDDFAREGLRVLAVACREVGGTDVANGAAGGAGPLTPETAERGLTFLGLEAMQDPPRPEVAAAVATCHRAGIRVVMITGDYGLTAESIARRVGILRAARARIITGPELDALDDGALRDALGGEVVFARVAPEQKLRIVAALQAAGHIVAVTGDGVNDAPALKKADIGVAMGVAGTDVAKEAADMILTDDNFASIVSAIEEGRAVYANIKKVIGYIFTSNMAEAVPFILFAFSHARIPLALNVMQILSIDLGTDMAPAVALGAERPEPGIMDRPPRSRGEHVLTAAVLRRAFLWLGVPQGLTAMAAFYFQYWTHGRWGQWLDLPASGEVYASATGMALAAVVASQIGNVFAHRTERASLLRVGLRGNPLLWAGVAIEIGVVLAVVYLPPLRWMFGTAPLGPASWLFLLAWVPSLVLVDELRKAFVRHGDARRAAVGAHRGAAEEA